MVDFIIPGWSWEEVMTDQQRIELANRIVHKLKSDLGSAAGAVLFVISGHPYYPPDLEKLLSGFANGAHNLERVERERRPHVYATTDEALFTRLLPNVFRDGPPEISVLSISCKYADRFSDRGELISDILAGRHRGEGKSVSMYFDSGDLLRE